MQRCTLRRPIERLPHRRGERRDLVVGQRLRPHESEARASSSSTTIPPPIRTRPRSGLGAAVAERTVAKTVCRPRPIHAQAGRADGAPTDPADPRNPMADGVTITYRHVHTLANELLC
jgi:hypothetical protein